jgi:polyphosphate kinase 2 (PPK2 family)
MEDLRETPQPNIVQFSSLQDLKKTKKEEQAYAAYLVDLSMKELSYEIDFLLSKISLKQFDKNNFQKIDEIINLLESRSTAGAAHLIRKIRQEIYERVKKFYCIL